MIDDKDQLKSLLLIAELNKNIRSIAGIYNISPNRISYIINAGEEEYNDQVHYDKFLLIRNNDMLKYINNIAVSSLSLYEILKNFKVTKSGYKIKEDGIHIYLDKEDKENCNGIINYSNENFIERLKKRYVILNDEYIKLLIDNYDNLITLSSDNIDRLIDGQQVSIMINNIPILFDKQMCTVNVKNIANIKIGIISNILNYKYDTKELVCLTEDILGKKDTILGTLFTIFAVQKI